MPISVPLQRQFIWNGTSFVVVDDNLILPSIVGSGSLIGVIIGLDTSLTYTPYSGPVSLPDGTMSLPGGIIIGASAIPSYGSITILAPLGSSPQSEVTVTIVDHSDHEFVLDITNIPRATINGGLGRDVLVIGADYALVRSHDGGYALTDAASGETRVTFHGIEVLRRPSGDLSLLPHAADFSAIGTDAVMWRHDDGTFWQWNLSGTSIAGGGGQTVGTDWTLLGTDDLYGDGHGSLVWRHAGDGAVWAWHMNGAAIAGGGSLAAVDESWSVVAMADFTGDGRSDILWRHAGDGALWLFAMNGTTIAAASGAVLNPGGPWAPVGAADLNGDGKADMLWRNADTGEFYAWTMDGTAVTTMASLGTPWAHGATDWALAGTGDFNGDGQADLLLRSADSGALLLWQTKPGGGHDELAPSNPGLAWQIASLADVNGDGFTDILWRNAESGLPYLWLMQGATILAQGALPDPGSHWHVVG